MIVTLTLIPSAIKVRIAGNPSMVAGTLIKTFGRFTLAHNSRACETVVDVSRANRGSTSMLTRPSTPADRSYTGMKRSHA